MGDHARTNLYGLNLEELAAAIAPLDATPYRARQLVSSLYHRDALDPGQWTDFPADLRRAIAQTFRIERPEVVGRVFAADGALKTTQRLPGGGEIEAVAIREPTRTTFCISSQVGCAFGCSFCMTAKLGFRRNIDAGEIAGQVAALSAETRAPRERVNIVFMGMGEPLHNFEPVMRAIDLLSHERGFAFSGRRITVSTVGLAHRIREMAERRTPVRLAVSLVAADQDIRSSLVPAARRWPLDELADAIRRFGRGRKDRPTLEVVLLRDVNDSPPLARRLADFARRTNAKVNLIEFNATPELPYLAASEERLQLFLRTLRDAGVVGTVRRSRGRDAFAACGQLAFLKNR